MKKLFLIFLLLSSTVFAEFTFKERLKQGEKGDFIVLEHNKIYSLISIFDNQNETIVLEEITIPKNKFNKKISFREWYDNKAKNHTSWAIYKINLKENKIKDAYSISRNCFISLSENESFITTLLDLKLKELSNNERKKIGPRPQFNDPDRRAIWHPIKIVDSQKIQNSFFNVYRSSWPNDGTEFAYKIFDIYFDNSFCFPYFIEINSGHTSYIIRAIDSGSSLTSKIAFLPKRKAEIVEMKYLENNLVLCLNNSDHYKDFNLFALDCSKKEKVIHPLNFEIKKENELVFLYINLSDLNKIFEKNHKYTLIATPKFHKDIFIESKDLLVWK